MISAASGNRMQLIDIGANLTDKSFARDQQDVLARAAAAGVTTCVVTGTTAPNTTAAIALCRLARATSGYELYATAGLHPHHAQDWTADSAAALAQQASAAEVVAIGETGLDFYRDLSPRPAQERAFEAQLEIAATLGLPVFMHERDAHDRQLAILRHYRHRLTDGVIHCFTGDRHSLFNYLDLDLHIGITGWICDPRRGSELQQLVDLIPLNRLMLETDAPYLLPRTLQTQPKNRRNEPAYLPCILQTVAACRPENETLVAAATTATARQFFRLPDKM